MLWLIVILLLYFYSFCCCCCCLYGFFMNIGVLDGRGLEILAFCGQKPFDTLKLSSYPLLCNGGNRRMKETTNEKCSWWQQLHLGWVSQKRIFFSKFWVHLYTDDKVIIVKLEIQKWIDKAIVWIFADYGDGLTLENDCLNHLLWGEKKFVIFLGRHME